MPYITLSPLPTNPRGHDGTPLPNRREHPRRSQQGAPRPVRTSLSPLRPRTSRKVGPDQFLVAVSPLRVSVDIPLPDSAELDRGGDGDLRPTRHDPRLGRCVARTDVHASDLAQPTHHRLYHRRPQHEQLGCSPWPR